MASESGTLYIGVTNNIKRRAFQHRIGLIKGFTQKYNCKKLVYYEEFRYINDAIKREKELKGWLRAKKEKLIRSANPGWCDMIIM